MRPFPFHLRPLVQRRAAGLAIAVAASFLVSAPATAQEVSLATVGDSATAWQWIQQMEDQARENPAEAARLAQRLLDAYDRKLVPAATDDRDLFTSVRERVHRFLVPRPAVLERYRAFESAEAERTLAAGDLAGTAATRAFTAAGLRASLILAERDVRAGRFASAEKRLADLAGHPDLRADEAAAYWFLRAVSARLAGRVADATEAAGRLANLDAPTWVEALAGVESLAAPGETDEVDPATFTDWQQVWREDVPGSPYARAFLGPRPPVNAPRSTMPGGFGSPRPFPTRLAGGDDSAWMALLPVVHGEMVLVNDGVRFRAIDRFSRRERWTRTIVDRSAFDTEPGPPADLVGIGVGDGVAVAYGGLNQGFDRAGGGTVVACDLESGTERWKISLPGLGGEEFGRLFPMGLPIVGDGQVIVLARRVTARLETVDYLLALDLADGSLRWSTFLCSSGGIRVLNNRPCSTPVLADGSIFVATGGGGVGRIDPSDGRIEWFRRFLVPIRDLRFPTEPWEMGGPVVLGNSVFAVAPDQSEAIQLDVRDGRTIASFPLGLAASWGSPRYLLADDARIFAIGSDLRAIDRDDPQRMLWSFAEENQALVAELGGSASRAGIRGRVALVDGHLLVPTLDRMLFVSASTGRVERSVPVDMPGNPILDPRADAPQMLVAGVAAISCLMPADAAERAMRARMVARPDDPQSALALLDLAVRGGRVGLAIEAARLAAAAIERRKAEDDAESERDQLLALLQTAAEGCGPGAVEAEPVHRLAREVARTPRQQAAQRLSEARWLVARAGAAEAVEILRPLAEDPAFTEVLLEPEPGRSVPASTVAIEVLQSLPPEALAAIPAAGAAPLPGTAAAISNRLAAASAAKPVDAMRILGDAWRSLPPGSVGDADARRVVAAIRALADGAGWRELPGQIDLAACGERPDGGFPCPVPPTTSRSGPVQEPLELPGRIPVRGPAESRDRPRDGFLLVEDRELAFRTGPGFERRWRRTLDDRNPVVLEWTPEAFLLWEDSTERGERATLVSRADGSTLGQTPAARDVLPAASLLEAGRPAGQIMPNDEPYLPTDVIPLVAGERLVVVRRSGDVASFRLGSLDRPDWLATRLLDQIYAFDLLDWGLLLAGVDRSPSGTDEIPTLLVLDPATGEVLSRTTLPDAVRWASLGLFGEAVAGTASGIHAVNGFTGKPLWSLTGLAGQGTVAAIRMGPGLIVGDAGEGLSGISLRDGRIDPTAYRIRVTGSVGGPAVAVVQIPEGTVVHREGRIQLFSPSGRGLGEDAIADDRTFTHVIPVEGGVVAVNALGGRQVPLPDRTGSRTEFPYLLYLLDATTGLRLAADPVEIRLPGQRIDRLLSIDGAFLLSSGASTVVLPVPFRDGERPGSTPR